MTPAVAVRIRRLDELRCSLAAEIVRVPYALPELSPAAREAYLAGLRDVMDGLGRAGVALATAKQ